MINSFLLSISGHLFLDGKGIVYLTVDLKIKLGLLMNLSLF